MRKSLAINELRPMTCTKPPCFRIFPHLSAYFRVLRGGRGWRSKCEMERLHHIISGKPGHITFHITLNREKSMAHHITSLLSLIFPASPGCGSGVRIYHARRNFRHSSETAKNLCFLLTLLCFPLPRMCAVRKLIPLICSGFFLERGRPSGRLGNLVPRFFTRSERLT